MEERNVRRRVLGGLANIFAGLAAVAEALSLGDEEAGAVLHNVTASTQTDLLGHPPLHDITVLRERLWYLQEYDSDAIDRFLDEHGERMRANGGIFATAPPRDEGSWGSRAPAAARMPGTPGTPS